MTVLVELIVAMFQVASVLVLLYGLSLTVDNGLEKALTFATKLRNRVGASRGQIDGLGSAA